MGEDERGLTIDELAEQVDVPVRTIRFYISEGLLPGPGARGRAAEYGEEHLVRLRLIRLLSEQRVPLAEIRERLMRLSRDELRALLAEEVQRAAQLERVGQALSPKEYVSALLQRSRAAQQPSPPALASRAWPSPRRLVRKMDTWRRVELAPGVELHIQADAEERHSDLIERLLRAAGVLVDRTGS